MTFKTWLLLFRSSVLVAVVASSALYAHYLSPAQSGFCGGASGCEAVRTSSLASLGTQQPYLNLPLVGILAYATLFALSLLRQPKRFVWLRWGSAFGGLAALALLLTQALAIGRFCWLCVLVDVAAVATAFSGISLHRTQAGASDEPIKAWAWAAILILAIASPLAFGSVKPNARVPEVIRAHYHPEKINVVEFADFACPYCRRLHPILKELLREYDGQVNFRRFHATSHDAQFATASLCAANQGKEEAMADLLFSQSITPGIGVVHAKTLGLDLPAFEQCIASDATRTLIDGHRDLLKTAGRTGLPTTYIGERRLVGLHPSAVYREALEQAKHGRTRFSISGLSYAALTFALGLLLCWLGRQRPGTKPASSSAIS